MHVRAAIYLIVFAGTEDLTFDEAMLELEESAVDLEASSPVECDWDFRLYNLPARGGGGGGGEPPIGGGGGDPPVGGGEGDGDNESPEGVQWQKGWFVAFPQPASNPCSVVVGKIEEVVRNDDGDELVVKWYAPKRRTMPRRRSMYGRGGWAQDFTVQKRSDGSSVRVAETGRESVHCACATFPELLASNQGLPQFVWDAVSDSVHPPPEDEEVEEEEEEEEKEEEEGGGERESQEGQGLEIQGAGGAGAADGAGDEQPHESGWREPVQMPSLALPVRVRRPAKVVPLTAAHYRPRRTGGAARPDPRAGGAGSSV